MKKVFLGGTCDGRNWRNELIPLLKINYYNPIVEDWSEEDRLREVHEREVDDYILYVITKDIKGVYSIAEVTDDANKRPEKTIFCVLEEGMEEQMLKSLKAVKNLVSGYGVYTCSTLKDVADFLNKEHIK